MKYKIIAIFLCFVLLFSCSCSKKPKMYTSDEASDVTVYITDTGSKYHTKKCYHLKKSCSEISLEEAVEDRLRPLLKLRPAGNKIIHNRKC